MELSLKLNINLFVVGEVLIRPTYSESRPTIRALLSAGAQKSPDEFLMLFSLPGVRNEGEFYRRT